MTAAYNELAWMYAEEERNLDEALQLIEEALRQAPDRPAFLDTKAAVLHKLQRHQEAIAIEEQLAREHPDEPFYARQLQKFKAALRKKLP